MTNSLPAVASLHRDLADQFAAFGVELASATDLPATFTTIAQRAVKTVPGAEHAGVTVLRRGEFDTPTATSELPPRVDAIQYELGTGPCVDAVLDDSIYRSGDLAADPRWPEFGRRAAAETGVQSMLAVRLYCEEPGLLAALNMYSLDRDAFPAAAEPLAILLATHASLAITAAGRQRKIENLEQAVASTREIGVAIGVLMTRHLVTQQQGFDLLRMASQRSHRKLRDVAAGVIETGALDFPPPVD
jgi:hypothetical protein